MRHWIRREEKSFRTLQGWSGELFAVYCLSTELLANRERAAFALFGIFGAKFLSCPPIHPRLVLLTFACRRGHLDTKIEVMGGVNSSEAMSTSLVLATGTTLPILWSWTNKHFKGALWVVHFRSVTHTETPRSLCTTARNSSWCIPRRIYRA